MVQGEEVGTLAAVYCFLAALLPNELTNERSSFVWGKYPCDAKLCPKSLAIPRGQRFHLRWGPIPGRGGCQPAHGPLCPVGPHVLHCQRLPGLRLCCARDRAPDTIVLWGGVGRRHRVGPPVGELAFGDGVIHPGCRNHLLALPRWRTLKPTSTGLGFLPAYACETPRPSPASLTVPGQLCV